MIASLFLLIDRVQSLRKATYHVPNKSNLMYIDVAGFEPTLTYIASKEDTRQLGGATSCKLACN